MEKTVHFILSMSLFSQKHRILQLFWSLRLYSLKQCSSSLLSSDSPIERKVKVVYLLTSVVSSGCRLIRLACAVSSSFKSHGLRPGTELAECTELSTRWSRSCHPNQCYWSLFWCPETAFWSYEMMEDTLCTKDVRISLKTHTKCITAAPSFMCLCVCTQRGLNNLSWQDE